MIIRFILLLAGAYLLGSIPLSYLVARERDIDLTEYGTGQVGAGNLWRMTRSWKLGIGVGVFDFGKGVLVMAIGRLLGLDTGLQIFAGTAAIIGHNWPLFLHFRGGRGVGTAIGMMVILPVMNHVTPWITIAFVGLGLLATLILRSSPLPVLAALVAAPIVGAALRVPLDLILGLTTMALVIILKRLTAPRSDVDVNTRTLLLNRLLFDRDIRNRRGWMYRKPEGPPSKRDQNP